MMESDFFIPPKLINTAKSVLNNLGAILFPAKCIFCRKELSTNNLTVSSLSFSRHTPAFTTSNEPLGYLSTGCKPVESQDFCICEKCYAKNCDLTYRRCAICDVFLDITYGPDICIGCKKTKHHFERNFSPLLYDGDVRSSILAYKFSKRTVNVKTFARLIHKRITECYPELELDYISYVPLSLKREITRGYNQCELLADELSELLSVPARELLVKLRESQPQSKMESLAQRKANVLNMYGVIPGNDLEVKTVLLIDDVFTTGSTINECARQLKAACAVVYTATVAIGYSRSH